MSLNPYVQNCPAHDIDRMLALYEERLVEVKAHIDHLKMLASLGSTDTAFTESPRRTVRIVDHGARFDVV